MTPKPLEVLRAADIALASQNARWLVRDVWARAAVGIVGGAPKCCKSWLGLDLAVSVASNTPCLDRFDVDHPGTALVYLAEDALPTVRARIDALCRHRGLDIARLDLHVIAAPVLRLDLDTDQQRLRDAIEELQPHILVLDPLVRLHRLDENSASDISRLLGFFRELQRAFDLAVVLVHHASKKHRAQPGQTLRGSSDLHAFGDSNAYLARDGDRLVLTLEHRAARPPEPLALQLVSLADGSQTHLAVVGGNPVTARATAADAEASLATLVAEALRASQSPLSRAALRAQLKVNNLRLGQTLTEMERRRTIERTTDGWRTPPPDRQLPLIP
jgi:hypothetical protein